MPARPRSGHAVRLSAGCARACPRGRARTATAPGCCTCARSRGRSRAGTGRLSSHGSFVPWMAMPPRWPVEHGAGAERAAGRLALAVDVEVAERRAVAGAAERHVEAAHEHAVLVVVEPVLVPDDHDVVRVPHRHVVGVRPIDDDQLGRWRRRRRGRRRPPCARADGSSRTRPASTGSAKRESEPSVAVSERLPGAGDAALDDDRAAGMRRRDGAAQHARCRRATGWPGTTS